jgi:hypothetical protein
MNKNIFETLKELGRKKVNQDSVANYSKVNQKQDSKRKDPSYIYLDEDNQIKEIPLSKLDSAGALIYKVMKKKQSPAKLIHDSIFGK